MCAYKFQNILLADYVHISHGIYKARLRGKIIGGFRYNFKIAGGFLHAFSRTISLNKVTGKIFRIIK